MYGVSSDNHLLDIKIVICTMLLSNHDRPSSSKCCSYCTSLWTDLQRNLRANYASYYISTYGSAYHDYPTFATPTITPIFATSFHCPLVSDATINCYFSACANILLFIDSNKTTRNFDCFFFNKKVLYGAGLSNVLFTSKSISTYFRTAKNSG